MIRSLQKRFVLAAMLSLLVLLVLLISGITAVSYLLMERNTDEALTAFSFEEHPPVSDPRERRPLFGYQVAPNPPLFMNHFTVIADASQTILSIDMGARPAEDAEELRGYAQKALAAGKDNGKLGAYKYRVTATSGGYKLIFLDVSVQARMLGDTLMAACLIGLLCMLLMFIILMAISRRTVRPIAHSIEQQQRFVTDAGHEIKTPLAIIQANTDAMELHIGRNKWITHIREQTGRLDGLMRQLLSLSQMDEGRADLPLEDVGLSELVTACVAAYDELDLGKDIQTVITPHMVVRANRESLTQLVSILMDNAVKYAGEHGRIRVNLSPAGKKAALEVSNTCPALPDADPQALFDRFYRADAARTQKNGGYGIGLSIAQAIVAQHKGRIAAFYDDAHTIRFRVEL